MKIDNGWLNKKLSELNEGDLFLYDGFIYIKLDIKPTNSTMNYCARLESGLVDCLSMTSTVRVIEDAVLKIGGYYK